jgi:hypothetical protein
MLRTVICRDFEGSRVNSGKTEHLGAWLTLVGFEPVAVDQLSARGQVGQFRQRRHFAAQCVVLVGFRTAEDRGYLLDRQNFCHVLLSSVL